MPSFIYFFLVVIFFMLSNNARSIDYYLNGTSYKANAQVIVNGIPFTKDESRSSFSGVVTQFLVDGKNEIDIYYIPTRSSNHLSSFTWSLIAVPDNAKQSSPEAEELAKGLFRSKTTSLAIMAKDDITTVYGTIDSGRNIHFLQQGKVFKWGGHLCSEVAFTRLPSQLNYSGLNGKLNKVKVHFVRSGTPVKVSYGRISLPSGEQQIPLTSEMIISGSQWVNEQGFDGIIIEGELDAASETDGLVMKGLSISEVQGLIHETQEVTLSIPRHWEWQNGDKYQFLTAGEKEELFSAVSALHEAIEVQDLQKLQVLFNTKTNILSRVVHRDIQVLEADQQRTFKDLFSRPDWKLKPLFEDEIDYILVCPQIVVIKTFDRQNVITSLPLKLDEYNAMAFEIPLYYAHIEGEWVVIW